MPDRVCFPSSWRHHGTQALTCSSFAAAKDPKAIWDESEVVDAVEDDIQDDRLVPE
jgi:hypothetical protein